RTPALGPKRSTRHTQNAFILALDVATFRPPAAFAADADELVDVIKSLPLRGGFDEILLPGERGRRTESVRRRTGIPIRSAAWDALGELAKKLAIELPPARARRLERAGTTTGERRVTCVPRLPLGEHE